MRNLIVTQEFIDQNHNRNAKGSKLSFEKAYADLLVEKGLAEYELTEEELEEQAKAKAEADESKAKEKAEAEKAEVKAKAETTKPKGK